MPRFEIGDCPKGSKDSRIHDRAGGRWRGRWWKTRGGGELEAYRRERAGWIGKKEEREREGDGNNRWEGWGMDAVIWRCMHHRLCHLAREDRPT